MIANAIPTIEQEQRIIELYLCSNDKRIHVISETLGADKISVSNTIRDFYHGKIEFKRGDFTVLHSSINNFN